MTSRETISLFCINVEQIIGFYAGSMDLGKTERLMKQETGESGRDSVFGEGVSRYARGEVGLPKEQSALIGAGGKARKCCKHWQVAGAGRFIADAPS